MFSKLHSELVLLYTQCWFNLNDNCGYELREEAHSFLTTNMFYFIRINSSSLCYDSVEKKDCFTHCTLCKINYSIGKLNENSIEHAIWYSEAYLVSSNNV